jgi:hypothetical protein
MLEYDLAVVGILWGTAIAFALSAVTMVDNKRKRLLITLWAIAAVFLVAAIAWPWAAEKWPAVKTVVQTVGGNQWAINSLGLAIFGLLIFDFVTRRRWLAKRGQIALPEGLLQKIEQIAGRVHSLEEAQALPTSLLGQTTSLDKRVVEIEKKVDTPASNPQVDRDLLMLMHFNVYQSTVLMLDDILRVAPLGVTIHDPLTLGGDFSLQQAAAREFIDVVRRKLDSGSHRRSIFENVMQSAEHEAEHNLEQTPMNERPSGIDHLALRRWTILHRQCGRAIAFIENERKEAELILIQQRFGLLERYSERNQ